MFKEDCMKKNYKRKAWLIDNGVILEGFTLKRKFYPNSFKCGFSYHKFNMRDIGKTIFFNKIEAEQKIS